MTARWGLILLVCACSASGAAPARDGNDPVLAHGQNIVIRVSHLQNALAVLSPAARAAYATPEGKRRLVEEVLRRELLVAEARRRGFDQSLDVTRATKQALIHALRAEQMKMRAQDIVITEDELRAYYDAHPEEYHHPLQRRVSHIFCAEQQRAERIAARLAISPTPDRFEQFARQYSEDGETQKVGGLIGWVAKDASGVPEAVRRAAFEVSPIPSSTGPVQSERGWHVVYVSAWRDAVDWTFEEAREAVHHVLSREKWERMVDLADAKQLEKKSIRLNEELLGLVQIAPPPKEDMSL